MLVVSKEQVLKIEGEVFCQRNDDWLKEVYGKEAHFSRSDIQWGYASDKLYHVSRDWCVEKKDDDEATTTAKRGRRKKT